MKTKRKKKKRSSARIIGEALAGLVVVWRETLRRPRRRALLLALALAFVVAMLVARIGTLRARIASGALFGVALVGATFVLVREGRRWDDPRAVIERLAGRADPDRAASALRALTLLDEDGEPGDPSTSPVLARLHVAQKLAALPHDAILREAAHAARVTNVVAIALGLGVLGLGGSHLFSVVEGADVLLARGGIAPVGLPYVEDLALTARPPEYLHQEERRRSPYGHLALPRGTLLTFRGTAIHAGRRLIVTDGKNEVPFVDDGSGGVVARWPLAESALLRIVARFGDVVVPEPDATDVTSIADEAPNVTLEGAPKTISLASPEGKSDIAIRYEATDDHGLREVELVLTSGTREERRVLARLDGETREDRGGSVLRPGDRFIRHSHAPVLVRVEAKDNDPITGPKWGHSESFTLLPPDVGEAEATRLDALRALRDAYVDVLAWRMENGPASSTFLADEKRGGDDVARTLERSLLGAGLALPPRLATLLKTHQKKMAQALATEQKGASAQTHAKVVSTTETMVLVIDGIVRGIAHKDARAASKQLADVADDLAQGLDDERAGRDLGRATTRTTAATQVLGGGEKQLARLGVLGRDLSGAIRAGLARVERARPTNDLHHAELAARDLAERLREADPSFGTRGGTGGHATGESGGESSASGEGEGEGSDAERAFNEAAQDLEQLDQDRGRDGARRTGARAFARRRRHEATERRREAACGRGARSREGSSERRRRKRHVVEQGRGGARARGTNGAVARERVAVGRRGERKTGAASDRRGEGDRGARALRKLGRPNGERRGQEARRREEEARARDQMGRGPTRADEEEGRRARER